MRVYHDNTHMRRRARVDANQGLVVDYFRKTGCSVAITSALGAGFPDLVVAKAGRTALVEVKDGSKPPSERQLTPAELSFEGAWHGRYAVVENLDDAAIVVAYLEGRQA